MSKISYLVYYAQALFVVLVISGATKKNWQYVMEKFEWVSTNESLISAKLRPIRIARGVYGLNGTINIGFEIDNTFKIQFKILRSNSGTSKFIETPLHIPQLPFYYFMTKYYKKYAMNDIKNCSDFPQFEGNFDTPTEIRNYYFNFCVMSTENMPTHMWTGFYKIVLDLEGPFVRFVCTVSSNVFSV
ncbi:uncharacterized protein LOC129916681 [Episyrphus balteatus]|uniref:uncharacterized protein LOC129916681 n=1 Tax=Episyrphus balteatus TaxID=286459 RepID=UPI002485F704|nr:uncharacterized protein LOC129916681 [Episyrphus balteatus]